VWHGSPSPTRGGSVGEVRWAEVVPPATWTGHTWKWPAVTLSSRLHQRADALSSTWVSKPSGMRWEARFVFPICLHEDGLQRTAPCIDFIPGRKPTTTLERGHTSKWYMDRLLRATNHPLQQQRLELSLLTCPLWSTQRQHIY
jgi:hypothetical protein